MKLLLENWRNFLNERDTDQVYSDLVDFFVDAYTDDRNFNYVSEEEEEEYSPTFDLDDETIKRFLDLGIFTEKDPNALENHTLHFKEPRAIEVVEKLKKIDPDAKFYPVDEDWEGHRLPSIEIHFDKDSSTLGSWDASNQDLKINFKFIMDEETYRSISTGDEIRQIIKSSDYKSMLKQVFHHELTHFLNSSRGGVDTGLMARNYSKTKKGKQMIAYLKKHFKKIPDEEAKKFIKYANSTEEIQARLIPIFKTIRTAIDSGEEIDSDSYETLAKIKDEVNKKSPSVQTIIKLIKDLYDFEHPHYWEVTVDHLRKKMLQRIYQFSLKLLEDKK